MEFVSGIHGSKAAGLGMKKFRSDQEQQNFENHGLIRNDGSTDLKLSDRKSEDLLYK